MPEVAEGLERAYFDTAATNLLYDAQHIRDGLVAESALNAS